ncbi:response regulator [Pseudorhizobium flavum]|uniref:response regulator n=1 Tax=Pseudorhizobium flavum TaxID=1335061 RepID=UPI002490F42D|nr:response regulator [Pseudorhizobium flavum]
MRLEGTRVFLVEDDDLVAMSVEDMLQEISCQVVDSAGSLDEAIEKARIGEFDCALLDVSLRGKEVYPVATVLAERNVPYIFASGYGRTALPPQFQDQPMVAKPFLVDDLAAALRALPD